MEVIYGVIREKLSIPGVLISVDWYDDSWSVLWFIDLSVLYVQFFYILIVLIFVHFEQFLSVILLTKMWILNKSIA